ncbi:hypothetical protein LUZ60_008056 [Juncus effusus]|nr:hypothetical protein LUZ60_008056 [Juncus effusus]
MDIFNMDSDMDEYSTDSSDSEEFQFEFEGRETLTKIDETLAKIDDFLSFERGFSHGDIVSSVFDPTGQLGRVIELDMAVNLETLSGEIVNKVNSQTLARLRAFLPGDYVVLGSWIGRVTDVFDLVNVLFDDGTKSEILVRDPDMLVPVEESRYEEIPSFYHPGQRVRVENDLTDTGTKTLNPKWLCGDWGVKGKENEGVICEIEIGLVKIRWILSVSHVWGENYKSTLPISPNYLQDPKNITLLSCFQHAKWQLGDWCTLLDADRTGTVPKYQNGCLKMEKNDHGRYKKGYRDEIFTVSKTKTLISVLWQNGSVSTRLDPQTLIPITNLGDHDFWPGQFVLEKEACSLNSNNKKIGVVNQVDAKERTVRVNWMENNCGAIIGDFNNEEIVSAYELVEHSEFSYCVGEVVVRLVEKEREKEKGKGKQNDLDFSSCFGNFVGFKDGFVEVKWANGVLSKVDPHEICGLERLAQIVPPPQANSVPLNPNSNSVPLNPNSNSGTDSVEQEKQEDEKPLEISSDNYTMGLFPKTAFDYFRNFASALFFTAGSSSSAEDEPSYQIVKPIESTQSDPIKEKTELKEKIKLPLKELNESEEKTEMPLKGLKESKEKTEMPLEELKKSEEKTELPLEELKESEKMEMPLEELKELEKKTEIPLDSEKQRQFKRFDVLNECSDNYFIDQVSEASQVKKSWLKKIQQEWSILENNLPESIYVRVYEDRMDILRACIIGADGTPYHDGLFFFDILFPPNYPHEPPTVHYHSFGLRLNPNLYESGKVCLSLLKTWSGTGTETWSPQSSTILQVLLSLQGLVLNEKPYFNEAGFDKQVGRLEGEKNSIGYNENVVLLTCKSMVYVVNKPPKDYEELVKEHFTIRAPSILRSCKAYLDGAQVGCVCDNKNLLGESSKSCSTGFKLMLAKLVPKLVSAFSQMGVYCDSLLELKCD